MFNPVLSAPYGQWGYERTVSRSVPGGCTISSRNPGRLNSLDGGTIAAEHLVYTTTDHVTAAREQSVQRTLFSVPSLIFEMAHLRPLINSTAAMIFANAGRKIRLAVKNENASKPLQREMDISYCLVHSATEPRENITVLGNHHPLLNVRDFHIGLILNGGGTSYPCLLLRFHPLSPPSERCHKDISRKFIDTTTATRS